MSGNLDKDFSFDLSIATPGSPHQWRPLVWREPRTGKDILLLSVIADINNDSKSKEEALNVHKKLMEMGDERPFIDDIVYEHQWEKDDLIIWDNVVLAHARNNFNAKEPRTLRRTPII